MPECDAHPLPDPDGCRHCGQPKRDHMQRWTDQAGWHKWTEPSDEQRLKRMKARRAARLAAKTPTPYAPPNPAVIYTASAEDTAIPVFNDIAEKLRAFASTPTEGT